MNHTDDTSAANGRVNDAGLPPRVHLFDYLLVFVRYRRTFLSIVIVGSLLAAAYMMVAPQTFTAGATLLPPDKSEGVSLASLVQSSSKLDFKALSENSSAENFVRILLSRTLADSLVRRFDLLQKWGLSPAEREVAINEVIGNLGVSSDRQGFIDITYNAKTGFVPSDQEQRVAATDAAKIVNASVEILDKLNQQKSVSRARRSREFIGRMKLIKRAELDTAQAAMLHFQVTNKTIALDKQLEASVEGVADLQVQINKAEVALSMARNELAEETPQVQNLKTQVAQLKAQKVRLEGGTAGGLALSLSMKGVPDLMRQLANLKLNLEVSTQIYTYLEAQYNQEQIQEARELPTVSVMDYANPPMRRSAPRRTVMMFVAVATLSVLATVLIFLLDAYRRSVENADPATRARLKQLLRRTKKESATNQSS